MLAPQQMCNERWLCARTLAAGKPSSRDKLSGNKLVMLSFTLPQSRPCTLLCRKPEWWALSPKPTQQHLRWRRRRAPAAHGWKTPTWGQSRCGIHKRMYPYACCDSPRHIVMRQLIEGCWVNLWVYNFSYSRASRHSRALMRHRM